MKTKQEAVFSKVFTPSEPKKCVENTKHISWNRVPEFITWDPQIFMFYYFRTQLLAKPSGIAIQNVHTAETLSKL